MKQHDFVEVQNRRWCLCCDLFQQKKPGSEFPTPRNDCPQNTRYALDRAIEAERSKVTA